MDTNLKNIFERVYAENTDALFRFVLFKVSDREQAVDIVEDAFVKFWQALNDEKIKQPRAFLYKITRNLIIDWYRKKKSVPVQNFAGSDSDDKEISMDMFVGNLTGADVGSEARLVIEKMKTLEPVYREAVYLRFVEELTPKEIAKVLGESPNVISVRINRGVNLLKSKLHV